VRQRTFAAEVRWRTENIADLADHHRLGVQLKGTDAMLYTIALVLLVLWALGLVTSYTMGGFIHVLLVIAIVMVLLRVISGRAVV
jgi:hypothetical protein